MLCSAVDSLGKSAVRVCCAPTQTARHTQSLALTAHFIFRTNEFIIREDAPLGGSAQRRVTAQISHHYLCSRYLRSNSLRPGRAASSTERHTRPAFRGSGPEHVQVTNGRAVKSTRISLNACRSVDGISAQITPYSNKHWLHVHV